MLLFFLQPATTDDLNSYTVQLTQGCQNSQCSTSTCYTFRKRASRAPVRRMTIVSARTVACYLAIHGDVESRLCPFLCPDSTEESSWTGLDNSGLSNPTQTDNVANNKHITLHGKQDSAQHSRNRTDPTSFVQHLFSTAALDVDIWCSSRCPRQEKPGASGTSDATFTESSSQPHYRQDRLNGLAAYFTLLGTSPLHMRTLNLKAK